MMSVMESDEWTGYIAKSLAVQKSRFEFRGGGATTAMNESLGFSCHGWYKDGPGKLQPGVTEYAGTETGQVLTAGLWEAELGRLSSKVW